MFSYPWLESTNTRIAHEINSWCEGAEPPYAASVVFGGGAYLQLLFQKEAYHLSLSLSSHPPYSALPFSAQ